MKKPPAERGQDILGGVDWVLIMSVNPGFGGQKFIPNALNKIKKVKEMIDQRGLKVEIEVDGGITPNNVGQVCQAGTDIVVADSAIYHTPDYKKTIALFRKKMEGY
jgi:ribulose-phosphate 3-epimerase